MLKLSFKDTPEYPAKVVQRSEEPNIVTTVTLIGTFKFPGVLSTIPQKLQDWIYHSGNVINVTPTDELRILAVGKATKAPEDADDPVLAEKIAEARAKRHLYKFICRLVSELLNHNKKLLYGDAQLHLTSSIHTLSDCLLKDKVRYGQLWQRECNYLHKLLADV